MIVTMGLHQFDAMASLIAQARALQQVYVRQVDTGGTKLELWERPEVTSLTKTLWSNLGAALDVLDPEHA